MNSNEYRITGQYSGAPYSTEPNSGAPNNTGPYSCASYSKEPNSRTLESTGPYSGAPYSTVRNEGLCIKGRPCLPSLRTSGGTIHAVASALCLVFYINAYL